MNKNMIRIIIITIMISTVIIILVASTSTQYMESMAPSIEDGLEIIDQTTIGLDNSDIPQMSESVEGVTENTNYIIDEDGNKRYILNVTDTPMLED